jgi:hypothetical protein
VDPGIYVFIKEGELYVLALYVDDSIIVGPTGSFVVGFKSAFGERFNVQDIGPVSWLLGMTVERDLGNLIIRIGQQQYVLAILERFNMMDCKPVGSPMAVDALSNCMETSTSKLPPGLVPYQILIGSLLYASVSTRPDIIMVVSHLSRYMSDPSQSHWEQAEPVLRYLKGTADSVLMYGGAPSLKVVGWSDSDYASDIGEQCALARVCVHAQRCSGELEKSAATNCGVVDSVGKIYGADCGHSGGDVFKATPP